MNRRPAVTGDRAVALDAGIVALIVLAASTTGADPSWMDWLVPLAMGLRMIAWARLPARERDPIGVELVFVLVCVVLGGFNDWNSVHRHRIYDYTARPELPELSLVPLWMLLFWGMILRLAVSIARWHRLGGWVVPHGGGVALAVQLALVVATRQLIYRYYLDPLVSWLVFAAALLVYLIVLRPGRPALRLMGLALIVGPLLEVLLIQVAGLHRYHLGWFGGVPLWIVLWWVLAIPIWADLSLRGTQLALGRDPA